MLLVLCLTKDFGSSTCVWFAKFQLQKPVPIKLGGLKKKKKNLKIIFDSDFENTNFSSMTKFRSGLNQIYNALTLKINTDCSL